MAESWRLARSLGVLRDEIRSRVPDARFWTIGDAAHRASWSDHNPNECCDVVCAADIPPEDGLDLDRLAKTIVATDPPALKYVIWRQRIWTPQAGWNDYGGAYHSHVHVSVGWGPDGRSTGPYDDTSPWGVATSGGSSLPSGRVAQPTLREDDSGPGVARLQSNLNEALGLDLAEDGRFGPNTAGGVRLLQQRAGITVDEIYGPDSAGALADLLEDDMPLTRDDVKTIWNTDGVVKAPSSALRDNPDNEYWAPSSFFRSIRNHAVTTLAEVRAAKKMSEATLNAVKGLDTKAVIAAVNARAAEDAQRDADLLAEVQELASGGATAQEIVDELARRIGEGG